MAEHRPELKHSLLTREEVVALVNRMRGADSADALVAFQELVSHNLRLAANIAERFYRPTSPIVRANVDLEDLYQAGNEGLMQAARKFDPSKERAFSTYATFWVEKYVIAYLKEQSLTIARPEELTAARLWIYNAREELTRQGVKDPSDEMVAALATEQRDLKRGRRVKRVIGANQVRLLRKYDTLRLSSYSAVEEALDVIKDRSTGPEQLAVATQMHQRLLSKIADLKPDQSRALDYRFGLASGEPLTLAQIGVIMGKSQPTIALLIESGLATLREKLGSELDDFASSHLDSVVA